MFLSPELEYLIRVAIIIPFFLVVSRFDPIAALSYSLLLVTTLLAYLANSSGEILEIYIPYIISPEEIINKNSFLIVKKVFIIHIHTQWSVP